MLATGLYTEPSKMWHKKLSSDKTWAGFNNFFADEYHDLHKLQHINTTQAGFHGSNMAITMQGNIFEALENLAMDTISEIDVPTQITSTTNNLTENKKF